MCHLSLTNSAPSPSLVQQSWHLLLDPRQHGLLHVRARHPQVQGWQGGQHPVQRHSRSVARWGSLHIQRPGTRKPWVPLAQQLRCLLPRRAGFHVVSASAMQCSLTGNYLPQVYTQCSWVDTTTLQLALAVNGDCSITVRPITATACAEAGQTSTYNYNDLIIRAYYKSTTEIASLLPTGETLLTTGAPLMSIKQEESALAIKFWGATNNPSVTVTDVSPPTDACGWARCPASVDMHFHGLDFQWVSDFVSK